MPASDSLAPPMTSAEREIVKSFGGWTAFCNTYGLKPQNSDENDEAKAILKGLAANDSR